MMSREVRSGDLDGDRLASTMVALHNLHFLCKDDSSGSSPSSPTSISIASLFDSLSEEEVVEILRRLPLKLATRCKSVSKSWCDLISSHHFTRSYLRFHDATPPQFALVHRYIGMIGCRLFRETPSPSDGGQVKLTLPPPRFQLKRIVEDPPNCPSYIEFLYLASSNGWVLCCFPDPLGEIYYVVNPLTNHRITLPPIPRTSERLCRVGFTLRAAAADSNHSSSSFRVVRFPPIDKVIGATLELDIFSSETGEWMQSTLSFSAKRAARGSNTYDSPLNNHAIDLNGKLHWLHVRFDNEIFAYDPYDPEKYRRMSLPEDCLGKIQYCFGTCHCEGQKRKHLKYLEYNQGVVCIWELKDYDKIEWCLLHRVTLSELTSCVTGTPHFDWPPTFYSNSRSYQHLMACHPWDRDLVLYKYRRRVLQCNMRLKTVEIFLDQGQEIKLNGRLPMTYFLFELPWWPTPAP